MGTGARSRKNSVGTSRVLLVSLHAQSGRKLPNCTVQQHTRDEDSDGSTHSCLLSTERVTRQTQSTARELGAAGHFLKSEEYPHGACMKPPTYAGESQIRAFFQWFGGERIKTNTSKTRLAEAIGREGTVYVNDILEGRRIPTPSTLRRLCMVMGVPWLVAFANIGYYRSILLALQGLVDITRQWCAEDQVYPSFGSPEFRYAGVLRIHGQLVTQSLRRSHYEKRYLVGTYCEANDEEQTTPCVVPKPLAVAIFVACAGFARRGDIYKDGLSPYAAHVMAAAHRLVDLADPVDDARKPRGLLGDADTALKNRSMPFDARRIVAAEYIAAWADELCQSYTHYARLAVYERWGEAGSEASEVTPFVLMPQIRLATPPRLTAFETT